MSYINLGQIVWPIGSIYMSSQSTSPATIFGGTWSQLSDEKFLLPSITYNNNGGEKTHTLSIQEMPNHKHEIYTLYNSGWEAQLGEHDRLFYGQYKPGRTLDEFFTTELNGGGATSQQYAALSYLLLLDSHRLIIEVI